MAIPGRKPKIVAFTESHGFSAKDTGKYVRGKMSQYITSRGERFYATNKPMLDILLRALFTRKPRVQQIIYR